MRARPFKASVSALLLLAAPIVNAKHDHNLLATIHKRHHAHREEHRSIPEIAESGIALRSPKSGNGKAGQCQFPNDAGLVAVTPQEQNAGWAMSPDQPCVPDSYCPYACPPGQVMMQWDPEATSYTYPKSMVSTLTMPQSHGLTRHRMAVCIVTRAGRSRSRSLKSHIAKMRRLESVP
jgi:Beta-glucosidase (SUN family)